MELLVPALAQGAKTSPDGYARVVTTSSSTSLLAPREVHFDTFKEHPSRLKVWPTALYGQSKLVCVLAAFPRDVAHGLAVAERHCCA